MFRTIWYELRKAFESKVIFIFYIAIILVSIISINKEYSYDIQVDIVKDKYPGNLLQYREDISTKLEELEQLIRKKEINYVSKYCPSLILDDGSYLLDNHEYKLTSEESDCINNSLNELREIRREEYVYYRIKSILEKYDERGLELTRLNNYTEEYYSFNPSSLIERTKDVIDVEEVYFIPGGDYEFASADIGYNVFGMLILVILGLFALFTNDKKNNVECLQVTSIKGRKIIDVKYLTAISFTLIAYLLTHIPYLIKVIYEYDFLSFWNSPRQVNYYKPYILWIDLTNGQYLLLRSLLILIGLISVTLIFTFIMQKTKTFVSSISIILLCILSSIVCLIVTESFSGNYLYQYIRDFSISMMFYMMSGDVFLKANANTDNYVKLIELYVVFGHLLIGLVLTMIGIRYYKKKQNI